MKKIYTIVILLIMGITQIHAQSCIECTGTTASTNKASSIGTGTRALGDNSFAGGYFSIAQANNSFVFGNVSKVLGLNGIAFGSNAEVNFADGIAIGNYATSNAANSYVFGQNLTGTGSNSLTLGIGTSSGSPLTNNKPNSIMFGVTNLPSLTIVKPTNGTIGYLGIGTNAPEEMAHIVGKLLIDRTSETESSLQFKHPNRRGDTQPTPDAYYWDIFSDTEGLKFNTANSNIAPVMPSQKMVITGNGFVGIGVSTPQAKLHVDNNILANGDITTLDKIILAPDCNLISKYWEISRTSAGLNYAYKDKKSSQNILFMGNDGSVGIGKTNPTAMLDVNGNFKAINATITGNLSANSMTVNELIFNDNLAVDTLSSNCAKVKGLICAEEIRVQLRGAECWPDYVFSKDYKLLPLVEVEQFITENQHLPNVPSSAEVEANGVELGAMNATLLQKVEELTLYIIQMEKRVAELEHKNK